jgi:hypothetical protein
VRQQRPAREAVQYFWQRRVHALSLPGGKHDDGEAHGGGF